MNTKMIMTKHKLSILSLAISLALAATQALAANTPDIGDAIRQAQPPSVPAPPVSVLPQVGGRPQIEGPMTRLPSGPTVEVHSIEIVGNRVIDTAMLAPLVADGVGKSLSLAELEALAQRITKHYRANGYFVARAYIPAQEVTSGSIKIRVVEGNYGKFKLKNASLVHDDIVQGMLDDVKHYDIVSLDTLERAMLIINDTPGVQVTRADVMPGEAVGTSDFAVDTAATQRLAGYVMLDNYGSIYTGRDRVSFNLDINSVTGHGDRLSLSGMDTNGNNLVNGRIGYSLPLAANGLRGEIAYSQTEYQLGNTYSALDATGTAKALDATVTYPIRRIRAQTLESSLNLAYKDLEDKIQSTATTTPKRSYSGTAGLSLRDERALLGLNGLTQASAKITLGQLDINDATALSHDAAGAQTQGFYSKLMLDLSRISLLPKGFTLTTAFKLQQSLNGKNLDGSERMAVSGSSAVMAYPSGELIGTDAAFVRAELSRPLPMLGKLQSNWLAFADWGEAREENPLAGERNRTISDVGLGWSANYSGALIHSYLTHRLSSRAVSESYASNKLLVQAGWAF